MNFAYGLLILFSLTAFRGRSRRWSFAAFRFFLSGICLSVRLSAPGRGIPVFFLLTTAPLGPGSRNLNGTQRNTGH